MIYLGIDGGGTKTAFMLIDEKGTILSFLIKNSCHYLQVGFDQFRNILSKGIAEICKEAGILVSEIDYSFLGLPAYGEIEEDINKLEEIVSQIFKQGNYKCGNDVEAGWAGSLACKPGINVVAGTGAIGYGKDPRGYSVRSSGWGHLCGDEGSAYWLGKKALELFTKEADGRLKKTPLYQIIRKELGLKRDFDIISKVTNDYRGKRDKIASLSKLLYKAALEKDSYALAVFLEAAYEFDLIIASLHKKLNFNEQEEILVSYSGGVFKAGSLILEPLEQLLRSRDDKIKLVKPILEPVSGAALYALKLTDLNFSQQIIQNLQEQEKMVFSCRDT